MTPIAIKENYVAFPKTESNQENFNGWICSYCRESDPSIEGGTIAHTNGGERHPTHKYCTLQHIARGACLCPSCRRPIALDNLLSLSDRAALLGNQALHTVKGSVRGSLEQFFLAGGWRHPMIPICVGLVSIVSGQLAHSPSSNLFGFLLQTMGTHQCLSSGSYRQINREIQTQTSEIMANLEKQEIKELDLKLSLLKDKIESQPQFSSWRQWIIGQLNAGDKVPISVGLKKINEIAQDSTWGENYIRGWRWAAVAGSAYYAVRLFV